MIKRYVKEGSGKTGPKLRIGRTVMALTILWSVSLFGSGVARAQTITFAGDADQGEGGRWMRSKVEQFSKETGTPVRYIARPVSTDFLQTTNQILIGQTSVDEGVQAMESKIKRDMR